MLLYITLESITLLCITLESILLLCIMLESILLLCITVESILFLCKNMTIEKVYCYFAKRLYNMKVNDSVEWLMKNDVHTLMNISYRLGKLIKYLLSFERLSS